MDCFAGGGEALLDVRPQQGACRLKVIEEVLEDEMMSGGWHGCVRQADPFSESMSADL